MPDLTERVMALHAELIALYDTNDMSKQAHAHYLDTLKAYTSAVALAASRAFGELLGIDPDSMTVLDLTGEQYTKLEASGMLDVYIDGKDRTDD